VRSWRLSAVKQDEVTTGPETHTKENESSWIFEPRLTCTNALRRVQNPGSSLVTSQLMVADELGNAGLHSGEPAITYKDEVWAGLRPRS
jgi:hypothetical protein